METIRLAFELSGIPYEDFRIDKEQWSELKASKLRKATRYVPIRLHHEILHARDNAKFIAFFAIQKLFSIRILLSACLFVVLVEML